jgi:hypothetical protein
MKSNSDFSQSQHFLEYFKVERVVIYRRTLIYYELTLCLTTVPLFQYAAFNHFYNAENIYEGVIKSYRTGRLDRELQMVQLSTNRCSCIAIL